MNTKIILLVLGFTGVVYAQTEPTGADVINQLPPELQGKVNATQLDEAKKKAAELFKEKCEKNAPGEYENIMKKVSDFPNCVKTRLQLPEMAKLKQQIEEASKTGSLDEVFKVYCAKTPEAKSCLNETLHVLNPCLSADEQSKMKMLYNIAEQLADFICFKEGDRIALFIAEGGPVCYQNRSEEIQQCSSEILGTEYQFDANNITANPIPQLEFGEKECNNLNKLQVCVVKTLQACKTPTPANIAESLFKFARKSTPCADKETAPGSASGLTIMSTTLMMAVATTLIF